MPRLRRSRRLTIAIIVGLVLLVAFYVHGSFDRPLYSVGLNFHECGRNGFGATFCGHELDEYRARIEHAKEVATHNQETISADQHKTEEEQVTREQAQHTEGLHRAEAKMAEEKRIYETEPTGSYGADLAKDEYEAARSELRQLQVGP